MAIRRVGFSTEEMNQIISYIKGYLQGVLKTTKAHFTRGFLKTIQSELTLYGCEEKKLFEKKFSSLEEYQQAIREFPERNQTEVQAQELKKLQETLQFIFNSEELIK